MTDTFGDVTVEQQGYVAVVEFHRPPDNFFNTTLIADLASALEALQETDCRAVVLASEGKNFCAGASLGGGGFDKLDTGGRHLYDEAVRVFATALPMVAAVQGAAIGGGLGVALAADFRVAAPESRFSANFARLGFHHGFGTTVTLPAVVGQQRAAELLLTGVRLNGEEAHRVGLVDRLVPHEQIRNEAHRFADEIAACGPLATRSIRETLRAGLAERVRAATEREKAEQARLSLTKDFAEGVAAMAERRAPNFEGH